jgi:GDP-L-fucose synthase
MDKNTGPLFDLRGKRVWVAGHNGMVGSALVRRLQREDCVILKASRDRVDLTRQLETEDWMKQMRPDVIFVAAARVGGIVANATYPADFIYINTMIAMNIMKAAAGLGVQKLLWLGSSCVYPKYAEQPISEDSLLTGSLEPTNEAYAIAKIAAIKLAEAYAKQYGVQSITVMPTNLYGPNDNFDLEKSHVLPALIRKMHEGKISNSDEVVVWGTGRALREFLHVDDLADACVYLMTHYGDAKLVNVGSGEELTIHDLAMLISEIVGYRGRIVFDTTKPDGTPRKLVDTSRIRALGWTPSIELHAGIANVYRIWQQQCRQVENAM